MRKYSPRRRMIHRIIISPLLIIIGFWVMLQTGYAGNSPGEIMVPILTSPLWLVGALLATSGIYILCLPLIRKGII